MSPELAQLANCLTGVEPLRRLGQALWMMLDRPVERPALLWARGLLGDDGDEILWSALRTEAVLAPPDNRVTAERLATMLGQLSEASATAEHLPRLVWTLPKELGLPAFEDSYAEAAVSLVEAAYTSVVLVSPFMEAKGVGRLLDALLKALKRGVHVLIVTHGASDLSSYASSAIEELRREAKGLEGHLEVLSARGELAVLLHSKLIVCDTSRAVVGSANLTGKGLTGNLEAGVILGPEHASEILKVVAALQHSGLVTQAF
jgi:hypothetical protein